MGDIRKMIGLNMRRYLKNPRLYIALLLTMSAVVFNFGDITEYLSQYDMQIQAGELFIFLISDRYSQWILMFAFLILVGDAPFMHEGMDILLMRTYKKRWLKAQITYMVFVIILWLAFLEICLVLLTAGYVFFDNKWSDYILLASRLQQGAENIGMGVNVSMLPLTQGKPYLLFGIALLYSILLYVYFGMWGMAANLLSGHSYGCLIVTCFLALRFALFNIFYNQKIFFLSPADLVDLTLQEVNPIMVMYTTVFFLIQIAVLIFVSEYILSKRDICRMR